MMEDDCIFHNKLLVELLCDSTDWLLTMAVAIIDHTIREQHSVMVVAGATTLALHDEVTTKVDGPTVGVKLQPPQMVFTVTIKGDMAALNFLTLHCVNHLGGVRALVFVAFHHFLQLLQRGVKEAGKGHRPTVVCSQLWVVGDILAIG